MLQKTPPISYPGELPPAAPRTISLWDQLRLSYETYPWLRLLCWVGLGLLGLLLLVLPGSFPPPVLMDIWHMLKAFPTFWHQQGIIAIFILLWNGLLVLLYLLLWGGLLLGCRKLGRFTWRLIRVRAMVANRWQPSSALRGPPTFDEAPTALVSATNSLRGNSIGGTGFVYNPPSLAPVGDREPLVRPITTLPTSANQSSLRQFMQPSTPLVRLKQSTDTSSSIGIPLPGSRSKNDSIPDLNSLLRPSAPAPGISNPFSADEPLNLFDAATSPHDSDPYAGDNLTEVHMTALKFGVPQIEFIEEEDTSTTGNLALQRSHSSSQVWSASDSQSRLLANSQPRPSSNNMTWPAKDSQNRLFNNNQARPATDSQSRSRKTIPISSNDSQSTLNSDWPALALSTGAGLAWDTGITRQGRPNEDSILTLHGACNFGDRLLPFELHIVADGMGGHAQGRLASRLALRGMLESVVPGLISSPDIQSEQVVDILIDSVHWANQVVYQAGQEQQNDMGTTLTAVLMLAETAYIVNVGDSRTYVYRPGSGLNQITRDHSLVARLVENGSIAPDDIYTHPERNKVYRGIGDKMDVTVDWFVLPVQPGDVFLLCSDGLWEMVRDPKIAEVLRAYASAPALASNALLRAALQAGGKDNISLLVVKVQH